MLGRRARWIYLYLEQVIEQLKVMPQDLQWQVLEFARALAGSTIQGVPGWQLLH